MRVVLAGITGLGKETIAAKVALDVAKARFGPRARLDDTLTRKYVQVLSVEDEIKNALGSLRPRDGHSLKQS